MAFGLDSWFKSGKKNDPRHVQWIVQLLETNDGNVTKTVYPLKTCTPEDMKEFYEPDANVVGKLETLISNGSLFCLDWKSLDFSLHGSWETDFNYRLLDVMAVPCLTKLSMLGSNYKGNEGVRDDCETDLKTTVDYMGGTVEIVTYKNHVKF